MPRVKKFVYHSSISGSLDIFTCNISVNTNGLFYAHMDEKYTDVIETTCTSKDTRVIGSKHKGLTLVAHSLNALETLITEVVQMYSKPTVAKELVICYNLSTDVRFATDIQGNIYPTAEATGTAWHVSENNPLHRPASDGGYSITIGARVYEKSTETYVNGKSRVIYSRYTGTPEAKLLNSWVGFNLPEDTKEMQYTAKNALFFYDLMNGMAKMCSMLERATGTPEAIQALISSNVKLLGGK